MWRSTATTDPEGRGRVCGWLAVALFIAGLTVPAAWEGLLRRLPPPAAARPSVVALDRQGQVLRVFMAPDGRWRLPIERDAVDPRFVALLIGCEDKRFLDHRGIDPYALARAAVQMAGRGRIVSGGSTLTMQVARLVEPRRTRGFGTKLHQMLRAAWLEDHLSKAAILDLYLERAPYGGNLEGVRAASLAYFGHEPRRLDLAEAALLVALPQSPEWRRPDRFPARAKASRDRILDRAAALGLATPAEIAHAKGEPVPPGRRPLPALAPHATARARGAAPQATVLHMTLDAGLERMSQDLVRLEAARFGPAVSGALLVIDNATGEILADIGAADYRSAPRAGALDMTRAWRSPGSTLKPFIYALAFEDGIASPETLIDDRPTHFGIYAPENFDGAYRGTVSARQALQLSLNLPAVALLDRLGPARLLARLREAGARVEIPDDQPAGLAIGLGGLGIRLVDLAALYSGLARGGDVPWLRESLDTVSAEPDRRPVADPVAAWSVADILRGAPPPDNALGGRIAFKTGTSYGYRDAWAVGFTRRTTIAAWLGRPDNAAVPGLVGRQAAAPILFDAFARLGAPLDPPPPPPGAEVRAARDLPVPLRRLHGAEAGGTRRVRISYPSDGATVDLGLDGATAALVLKLEGGTPPFAWFVNGIPAGSSPRRENSWRPDGEGFARISVSDAKGASDAVSVRLR
ncbi:MAG TPA: penicillin-binding protein 1C [Lichenihabitans sp.]|jgi:penicillin-binding protein 1C|nr:penicillin-binding protein 1C [Lichenihabitans sp.]